MVQGTLVDRRIPCFLGVRVVHFHREHRCVQSQGLPAARWAPEVPDDQSVLEYRSDLSLPEAQVDLAVQVVQEILKHK